MAQDSMQEDGPQVGTDRDLKVWGTKEGASFQVIVLGAFGGPREDSVTGMLVRAPQAEWRKGSVIAVDAGAHLASIVRILEDEMPRSSATVPHKDHVTVLEKGPFAGIRFPHISAKANALYIFRELLHSVLITHPHLDHVSGIAINTPALEYGREAKAIVALPSTIEAIKNHIFNDWIWPNLSDEGHGVGFVTYRRLIEGGNPRLGLGEARGYVNVCDGLATKCWGVSHGKCHRRSHSIAHTRGDSFAMSGNEYNFSSRRLSRLSDDHGYFATMAYQQAQYPGGYPGYPSYPGYPPNMPNMMGMPPGQSTPGIPGASQPPSALESAHMFEPVTSSAFFIRNHETGHELLIFGDIEPDSVSMSPRNHIVWDDAASKIVSGSLKAIFIECSYDDSVRNEDLYGHLCPRHLVAELTFLAKCVINLRKQNAGDAVHAENRDGMTQAPGLNSMLEMNMSQPPTPAELKKKRKRALNNGDLITTPELGPSHFGTPPSPGALESGYVGSRSASGTRRKQSHGAHTSDHRSTEGRSVTPARGRSVQFHATGHPITNTTTLAIVPPSAHSVSSRPPTPREKLGGEPLKGVSIHIIHVKDTLEDGPAPGDIIIEQVRKLAAEAGLGAVFDVTSYGQSIWI